MAENNLEIPIIGEIVLHGPHQVAVKYKIHKELLDFNIWWRSFWSDKVTTDIIK